MSRPTHPTWKVCPPIKQSFFFSWPKPLKVHLMRFPHSWLAENWSETAFDDQPIIDSGHSFRNGYKLLSLEQISDHFVSENKHILLWLWLFWTMWKDTKHAWKYLWKSHAFITHTPNFWIHVEQSNVTNWQVLFCVYF